MTDTRRLSDDEIDAAVTDLMKRVAGWRVGSGGTIGSIYEYPDYRPVGAAPGRFRPSWSWECAMLAAEEWARHGRELRLSFGPGRCSPRMVCEAILVADMASAAGRTDDNLRAAFGG